FLTATPTASTYSLSLHDALPIFAAFEVLFLPDRRHELERVDARMARFDRVAPMRSGDCDADAGFPERNDSDPVHDRNAHELPFRSEEHTSELQSRGHLVCRLLLE